MLDTLCTEVGDSSFRIRSIDCAIARSGASSADSTSGFSVRWTLVALRFPDGPDRLAQPILPAMFALAPVEHSVVGEASDVRVDVTSSGG
jgi:hypothetical protein